jgi:hypothetical protein
VLQVSPLLTGYTLVFTCWFLYLSSTFTNLSISLTNQSFFQSSRNLLLGSKLELWSFVQLFWLALIIDCNFYIFPQLLSPTLAFFWSIIAVFSFPFIWLIDLPESPIFHLKFLFVKALIYGLNYLTGFFLFVVYNCACLYLWNFPSLFVIWPSTFCSILFKNFLLNPYFLSECWIFRKTLQVCSILITIWT